MRLINSLTQIPVKIITSIPPRFKISVNCNILGSGMPQYYLRNMLAAWSGFEFENLNNFFKVFLENTDTDPCSIFFEETIDAKVKENL